MSENGAITVDASELESFYTLCAIVCINGEFSTAASEAHVWNLETDMPKWEKYMDAGLSPLDAVRSYFMVN